MFVRWNLERWARYAAQSENLDWFAVKEEAIHAPETPLSGACSVCGSNEDLITCPHCRCTAWCSTRHRETDDESHRELCLQIRQCYEELDYLRAILVINSKQPLSDAIGRFWEKGETTEYLTKMFKLFRLQSRSRHETAVKEQLRCGLLILRLGGQQDPLNMTSLIPPLFYRIGQYQEMYNFICWRLLSDTAPSTAHMYLGDRLAAMRPRRSPILPDMADIFEDISVFGRVQFPPWILLSLCLLKIKMYLELRQFHQITQRLRPSLTNLTVLRDHCQIPEIRNNRRLLDQESFRQLILQRLLDNIRQLIDRIELRDPLVLLQLAMAARKGGPGRWDHMNDLEQKAVGLLHFRMIYQAWAETPRSISALAAIAYSREEDENEELMVPAQ